MCLEAEIPLERVDDVVERRRRARGLYDGARQDAAGLAAGRRAPEVDAVDAEAGAAVRGGAPDPPDARSRANVQVDRLAHSAARQVRVKGHHAERSLHAGRCLEHDLLEATPSPDFRDDQ